MIPHSTFYSFDNLKISYWIFLKRESIMSLIVHVSSLFSTFQSTFDELVLLKNI